MSDTKKIGNALVSVFSKDGLEPIVKKLNALGVGIYSTGGTQKFIEDLGVPVTAVENLTSYPSILGGRVKTLHPKVFGGILGRREMESDVMQLEEYEIPEIDLVIVDLYPFEQTLADGASHQEIIEKIDIGGISLIRAAAKNYKDVLIVPSVNQYADLLALLEQNEGSTTEEDRLQFATEAFNVSSHYDSAIYGWFSNGNGNFKSSVQSSRSLRYGENPHQEGKFYGDLDSLLEQIHGKELSYNNLLDVDAAVNLIGEFEEDEPTFAILKHNNACGIASRDNLADAYTAALAGDPISAFGGILICNKPIDIATAERIHELFCEVVIAPAFEEDALELLKGKKNRILLKQKGKLGEQKQFRTILNGVLEQEKDTVNVNPQTLKTITKKAPSPEAIEDLLFANKVVKHTKSNTIVLAKGRQLLASGTGQTSRVDALNQAIAKAKHFGFELRGAVMASDAFFPFPDCVEIASKEGILDVIQPGGSVKDQDSIDYCDANDMSMIMTGIRHFKH